MKLGLLGLMAAFALGSTHVHAQTPVGELQTPMYIQHSGGDRLGRELFMGLKERVASSPLYAEVESGFNLPRAVIMLVTIHPESDTATSQTYTIYAVSVAVSVPESGNLLQTTLVGTCGASRISNCAASILSEADAAIGSQLRNAINDALLRAANRPN